VGSAKCRKGLEAGGLPCSQLPSGRRELLAERPGWRQVLIKIAECLLESR
jgi:hypothetical protein